MRISGIRVWFSGPGRTTADLNYVGEAFRRRADFGVLRAAEIADFVASPGEITRRVQAQFPKRTL